MQEKLFKSLSLGLFGVGLLIFGIHLMEEHPSIGTFVTILGGFSIVDIIEVWSDKKKDK